MLEKIKHFIISLLVCIGLMFVWAGAASAAEFTDSDFQEELCSPDVGVKGYTREDRTLLCQTETHVVIFVQVSKGLDAIGKALHYSRITGLEAGIMFISYDIENDKDEVAAIIKVLMAFELPIYTWLVTEEIFDNG